MRRELRPVPTPQSTQGPSAGDSNTRRNQGRAVLFLQCALQRETATRAAGVALVITPILTVVNHWNEIVAGEIGQRFIVQVVLTFLVPYSVSTFSSARAEMAHRDR